MVRDTAQGAWIAGDVGSQSNPNVGGVLLHWTGSSWVSVTIPFQTGGLGPLSQDGNGGVWINNGAEMADYNAGQWAQVPIAVDSSSELSQVTAMRLIPQTQSVWASGSVVANDTNQGVMLEGGL